MRIQRTSRLLPFVRQGVPYVVGLHIQEHFKRALRVGTRARHRRRPACWRIGVGGAPLPCRWSTRRTSCRTWGRSSSLSCRQTKYRTSRQNPASGATRR